MKKLLLGLFAAVLFTGSAVAQYKTTDKVPTSVSLTAKFHAVITYLETKELYRAGMSREEFVKVTTSCVEEKEIVEIFAPYMGKVYDYHTQKLSSDKVYDMVTGEDFVAMANRLRAYEETSGHTASLKKPWWVNWLRKAIDFIDDNWK
ncbi:MAG TPA: hypothetical protein VF581_02855 [Flavobacterium sp.]|jgi:hypothetical protein